MNLMEEMLVRGIRAKFLGVRCNTRDEALITAGRAMQIANELGIAKYLAIGVRESGHQFEAWHVLVLHKGQDARNFYKDAEWLPCETK